MVNMFSRRAILYRRCIRKNQAAGERHRELERERFLRGDRLSRKTRVLVSLTRIRRKHLLALLCTIEPDLPVIPCDVGERDRRGNERLARKLARSRKLSLVVDDIRRWREDTNNTAGTGRERLSRNES